MRVRLKQEEYECGVSVAGSDKQEWAFTLYDFDGRGKITKEDLGQLLKSLYDAVGSSISLPKAGAKSLKLKLTVSPDHTKSTGGSNKTTTTTTTTMALVSSPSKTGATNGHHRHSKIRAAHRANKHSKDKENRHKDSGGGGGHKLNNLGSGGGGGHEKSVGEGKNNIGVGRVPQNGVAAVVGGDMSSSEQKQLVELVQKNMDRHHRQLKKVRRHNSDQVTSSRRRSSGTPNATSPREQENPDRRNYYMDLAGIDHDPNTEKVLNTSAPAAMVENLVDTPPNMHASKHGKSSSSSKHHKSSKHHHHKRDRDGGGGGSGGREGKRSHKQSLSPHSEEPSTAVTSPSAAAAAVLMLDPVVNNEIERTAEQLVVTTTPPPPPPAVLQDITPAAHQSTPSPRISPQSQPKLSSTPKSHHRVRPVSSPIIVKDMGGCGAALSPHHQRRHKHRDKQHARAMQQVAAWIEREHALSPTSGAGAGAVVLDGRHGGECGVVAGEHMLITRHEHHHIHEHHHHHHYHHYHEA